MRLVTPAEGKGLRLWTLPVKAPMLVGQSYNLSFWARGRSHSGSSASGTGSSASTLLVGMEALFGEANVTCPDGSWGQCSYTPQQVQLRDEWTLHQFVAPCRFVPDRSGYNGAAGMVSMELASVGTAWVDDLALSLSHPVSP